MRSLQAILAIILIIVVNALLIESRRNSKFDYHLKINLDKDSIHIKTKHGEKFTIHADSLQTFINTDNI